MRYPIIIAGLLAGALSVSVAWRSSGAGDESVRPALEPKSDVPKRDNVTDEWVHYAVADGLWPVAPRGTLSITVDDTTKVGFFTQGLPLWNQGTVTMGKNGGLRFTNTANVKGWPSILQEGAKSSWNWYTGSDVYATAGMSVTDGTVTIHPFALKTSTRALLRGNLILGDGKSKPTLSTSSPTIQFLVEGTGTWNSGTYEPEFDPTTANKTSLWRVTDTLTIGAKATVKPTALKGNAKSGSTWVLLRGEKGITGTPTLVPPDDTGWELIASPDATEILLRKK